MFFVWFFLMVFVDETSMTPNHRKTAASRPLRRLFFFDVVSTHVGALKLSVVVGRKRQGRPVVQCLSLNWGTQ